MTTTRRSPRTRRIAAGLLLALTAALMAVPATTTLAADGDTMGERLLALALEAHAAGLDLEQELRGAVRSLVEEPRGSGPE